LDRVKTILANVQRGIQSDLCILDFSKALYKVAQSRLIEKLKWYGVDGSLNNVDQRMPGW